MTVLRRTSMMRGMGVLAAGMVAAVVLAAAPATSAPKFATKKWVKSYTYSKAGADARFINVGEKASDSDKLDGQDSTAFLGASAKAADADKLDGLDGLAYGETLWAVVESDGTLVRGRGVLASFKRIPVGGYEIVFTRNIDTCAYTGTVWDSTAVRGEAAPDGQIGIAPLSTSPSNGLSVSTNDSAGSNVDRDYIVVVHC